MHIETLLTYLTLTVIGLLPIMNPPTTASIFLGLSKGKDKQYMTQVSKTVGVYLFFALTITFLIGTSILEIFSISIPSLRLGGGMIIMVIGFNMLFPKPTVDECPNSKGSIALVPLTIPSLCGPGTMALIISLAAEIASDQQPLASWSIYSGVIIGFAIVAAIAALTLSMAYPLQKLLGESGINAFTRIMGFLLICMGVQFFTAGMSEVVQEIAATL
ncbi:MarC family NAAT transporter [Shewanella sp. UCD-KL12]|uniref:MarC family NAAT transporter n=1 Tax=Shewanella sp. UCD-KL12 TaxID=1917163 RepID=UPI0009F8719D|nr:MarC family NAAT transporter [Shewanella sp. UCD-KL12]